MSWPGSDPYYSYNQDQANIRRQAHSVIWVPWMGIDGADDLNTETSSVDDWEDRILSQSIVTAPLGLSITGSIDYQTAGTCEITLEPETGINGDYTMHVALVEDSLYYMGSNGYPDHHGVMRRMYPSAYGTTITLSENVTSVEMVTIEMPLDFEVSLENCRIVVFVQDSTNAVLNAATMNLTDITPLNIPFLSITSGSSEVIDTNDDGKLNPGESANLSVTVANRCEWSEAEGLTGYLTSSSPYVTIMDSIGTFANIPGCNAASNEMDKFTFAVSDDAPRVNELDFTVRLVSNQSAGVPYETLESVSVTMDMYQVHFPTAIENGVVSGSAVIDLDADGQQEIVFGGMDSMLHVLTLDGNEFQGFPFAVDSKITSAPAIGDVDNDGELEIVATTIDGGIYVIQTDGSGELVAQAEDNILATPAIDDLDGDGDMEIVTAGFGYDLMAIHHDGSALTGYPIIIDGERMEGAAAIADLDGDGSKDIIVGTKGDYMHVYDVNGNSLPGFPVDLGRDVKTAPVITDLTGDGSLEIITGQRSGIVYALSSDGIILWNHQLASVPILNPPAVFDYNQDGLMETAYVLPDGRLSVLDYAGNMMAGWPQSMALTAFSSPTIADLDGDGVPEIILGDDSNDLYAYHIDGTLMENFPMTMDARVHCSATVADLDLDGNLEIILGTDASLTVVDMPDDSAIPNTWFTSRGNYQRTGYFPNDLVGVSDMNQLPKQVYLDQNYPNPFNPSTTIKFGLSEAGPTRLDIFDVQGRKVTSLMNAHVAAGNYALQWNGMDAAGGLVATGIYFARLEAGENENIIKLMFIK